MDPVPLEISCSIHGEWTISEPVLIELINSDPIQRLKLIAQHGISPIAGLVDQTVTRYEHSVGAMLLVRRVGASVETQAAALLHDVSHTALSHVMDQVFNQVIHEVDKRHFCDSTNLDEILKRHGLDPERVLNEENYTLVERPAPDLCADRLDYGIRDAVVFGFLTSSEAKSLLRDDIITFHIPEGDILACKSVEGAKKLAISYANTDNEAWSSPIHSVNYIYAADAIRLALKRKVIEKKDVWEDDETFWGRLLNSSDIEVKALARKVGSVIDVVETKEEPNSIDVLEFTSKIRTIDPHVLVVAKDGGGGGDIQRLSQLDDDYKQWVKAYLDRKRGLKRFKIRSKNV